MLKRYNSCVDGLTRGLCPSCREPIQQHIRVFSDPPRTVPPSQLLLDTKENVKKACVFLDRYPGLDSDFSDRIDDLLALCVPKEESVCQISARCQNHTTNSGHRRIELYPCSKLSKS